MGMKKEDNYLIHHGAKPSVALDTEDTEEHGGGGGKE